MNENHRVPQWAPRLPKKIIHQLYLNDALGIHDEGLIDDVGYRLLMRCRSFIIANKAVRGKATCPVCSSIIPHHKRKDEFLVCNCGWKLSWGEYFATIQHKQLSGAEPVIMLFMKFVKQFPVSRSYKNKILLIDEVIHGFHWYAKNNTPTRPVAINLIEGRLKDVIDFLDALSYSTKSVSELSQTKRVWDENVKYVRSWVPNDQQSNDKQPRDKKNVKE
ncbi:MAG: hypothetical protein NWF13_00330 [Candidatus Bathyarchaeota archaeon]|nr:hypothetical protein [Candidatus Bathyarchaeota archaeon]